jgi:hypothetical protein
MPPLASTFPVFGSGEPGEVRISLRFATTTTGAVGAIRRKRGFGTPTRTGAGAYTAPLSEAWPTGSLTGVRAYCFGGGAFNAATPNRDAAILTVTEGGTTPGITVQFARDDTGAAADVRDGAEIVVEAWLKNITV